MRNNLIDWCEVIWRLCAWVAYLALCLLLVKKRKKFFFICPPELGTRQYFSFATTTTRQLNRASGISQGQEKIRKKVRPQCLDGVATTSIVKWQLQTTLWHGPIVATELSRAQLCNSVHLKAWNWSCLKWPCCDFKI